MENRTSRPEYPLPGTVHRRRLETAARECGGLNEPTWLLLPPWEQELWCSRAWAAVTTWERNGR